MLFIFKIDVVFNIFDMKVEIFFNWLFLDFIWVKIELVMEILVELYGIK